MTAAVGVSDHDAMLAITSSPHLLAAADAIKTNDPRDGGRPAAFSPYVLFLAHVLIKRVWGGRVRRGIREMSSSMVWRELQRAVRAAHPDRPDIWLPDTPPKRHHYMHFRYTYIDSDEGIHAASEALLASGLENAAAFGLCQEGDVSRTHPSLGNCIAGDGKVISAASKFRAGDPVADKQTGEILRYRRADPDVKMHREGGSDTPVRGHRFVDISARGGGYYQRAIFAMAEAYEGSELDAVTKVLDRLEHELNIVALLYDGAARGAHIDSILRRYGIVVIAPVAPKRAAKEEGEARVEHQVPIEKVTAKNGNGDTRTVEVWAERGMACEAEVAFDGSRLLTQLTLKRIEHRANRRAGHRLYGIYATPDGYHLRLALYQTEEDDQQKRNRCEHLRAFGMDTEQYATLYPRRSDSEAMHRQMEDALWQKRANCYGRRRVHADVLAWAIGENAISAYMNGLRLGDPPGELAA